MQLRLDFTGNPDLREGSIQDPLPLPSAQILQFKLPETPSCELVNEILEYAKKLSW
jgi:hypothetical protein